MAAPFRDIQAAGVVVFRRVPDGREVLLVHRPKYDDWSFPKGKFERGEHATAAAVREVEEETGLRVRLTQPLGPQRYPVKDGHKQVHYWTGRVADPEHDDVGDYVREDEIDHVEWVPVAKALRRLTYPRDRATLREALQAHKKTRTFVVLRHAESWSRNAWHEDDRLRPLAAAGRRQALALVDVLAAYGVRRMVSSDSVRCVATLEPYAGSVDGTIEETPLLSEEGASPKRARRLVRVLLDEVKHAGPTVVCTHRPVLPQVFAALGVPDPGLKKGELLVLHLSRGTVRGIERHGV